MQTKVKGTRVQYTFDEAVQRYRYFCHQHYLDEVKILDVHYDKNQNLFRLFGYDGKLVHAFMPEVVVDDNHKLEVGYIAHKRSTMPYNAIK